MAEGGEGGSGEVGEELVVPFYDEGTDAGCIDLAKGLFDETMFDFSRARVCKDGAEVVVSAGNRDGKV